MESYLQSHPFKGQAIKKYDYISQDIKYRNEPSIYSDSTQNLEIFSKSRININIVSWSLHKIKIFFLNMGIRFHMWKLIYNSIFSKDKPLKNMIILEFFQFPSQVIKYLNNPSIHSVSIQNLKIFSKSRIKIFICTGSAKYFFFLENALKKTTEYFLTKLKKNVRLRTLYISFKL